MDGSGKMEKLLSEINQIKQDTDISLIINKKLTSFEYFKKKGSNEELFSELCFCILTANCKAKTCLEIQNSSQINFQKATQKEIKRHLTKHHYRFPNIRTKYIINAQQYSNTIRKILNDHNGLDRREWFVQNIRGLGMKEASHFLRNIGYKHYAIIDTHILNLLDRTDYVKKPKTITKKNYLSIEDKLKTLAKEAHLNLASLDLYLWYIQTGMIIK